jgi:hypothetical protein
MSVVLLQRNLIMIFQILSHGLGLVRHWLSKGVWAAYVTFTVPWRTIYHLSCIAFTPKLVNDDAKSDILHSPSSPKYEDLEDYVYKPLPSERCIRTLRIYGTWITGKQEIECELLPLDLDDPWASVAYQAVSYTWDGQVPDRYIKCAGRRLKVTKNCEAILFELREKIGIVLWIDAICIDQSNKEEKETQIPLMTEIYTRSIQVIIGLVDQLWEMV